MADSKERKDTGVDAGTSGSRRTVDWGGQDEYWRDNYGARPYTQADRGYEYYQPAYKYGHESAFFYGGRAWGSQGGRGLEGGWGQGPGEAARRWVGGEGAGPGGL